MAVDDKKIIYSMVKVGKTHGQKNVLQDISLSFYYGAKIGILGLNGAGKSSLLRIMAGQDDQHRGETHLSDGYTVGFLEQEPKLKSGSTVRQVVEEGAADTVKLLRRFEEINQKFGEDLSPEAMDKLITEQADVQEKLDASDAWSLDDKLNYAMEVLRCPAPEAIVDQLSGGERRRVALCRLLIQQPDILLLDEPTNHLDAESVQWLERHLQDYKGTVIAVTHDRYFLDNVAGWILELDRGQGIPWRGNYSSWLEQKQARLAHEEKVETRRVKTLERELAWIKMGQKGRQSKGKARVSAYEKLLAQGEQELERALQIFIPPGPRLGQVVIEAKNLSKTYGEKVLYQDLNFSLPPGGIVGIIGPNGAGKTTLFRMIMGLEQADQGSLRVGETVKLGYMEQSREALSADKTVFEVVSGGSETVTVGKQELNARAYLGRFNISGQDQQKKISVLSGGERNRVQLALLLKSGANVLLLDEPTNDLDVNTLRALEEGLEEFAGSAVIISHDRWFLDRVATHILAFEGDSRVVWFDGPYSAYEEDRRARLGREADTPKRLRYSQITR